MWGINMQKIVDEKGFAKGMKVVLVERGVNTTHMKATDMRMVLGGIHI